VTVQGELSRRIDERYGLRSDNINYTAQGKSGDDF
jgi:hypothetical protein